MKKIIKIGNEARIELGKGAEYMGKAISSTLGPYGQNFFLEKKNKVTNDGITIAREITLPDEIQNRGATAIREAGQKTNDEVGEGTTTAITLASAIYSACSRLLGKEGIIGKKSYTEVINQIEKERQEVEAKLLTMATPIETEEQLVHSATVSSESEELGNLIGSAQWEIGKDGILTAEETAEKTSSVEKVAGIRIDNGFTTSFLINNLEKEQLEITDTHIILTSYTMRDLTPVIKIIEQLNKTGIKTITIIARAWTEVGIKTCLENIQKGYKIYPLNAPYENMGQKMKDIEAVIGGTFYNSESHNLEDMQISDVGFAHKIIAKRFSATITGQDDEKTKERVLKRINELEAELKGTASEFEKKNLAGRIAQLKNGFSVIKVGSSSEMERQRLFDKVEDTVNAVKWAFQDGTVKGAGLAFKEIAESLPDDYILKRPLMSINEQIMFSAPEGFKVEDWVRDPVKVLIVALRNACITASTFATAGGVIVKENEKDIDTILRARQSN